MFAGAGRGGGRREGRLAHYRGEQRGEEQILRHVYTFMTRSYECLKRSIHCTFEWGIKSGE